MVDMSMISGVYTSLNVAANIAKTMVGLRDAAMIQEKVIELQSAILSAQQGAFAANEERTTLIERVRQLETDVRRLEAWEAEKQRYTLEQLPPGVFVYSLKPEMAAGEPAHHICQTCCQRGKKSILHSNAPSHGQTKLTCHECGTTLTTGYFQPPPQGRIRSSW